MQWWGLIEKEYGWTGVSTAVKFAFTVCQFDYSYLIFVTLICSVNNIMYLSLGVLHLVDISLFIYKKETSSIFLWIISWSLFIYLYNWANKLGSILYVITVIEVYSFSIFLFLFRDEPFPVRLLFLQTKWFDYPNFLSHVILLSSCQPVILQSTCHFIKADTWFWTAHNKRAD